MKTNIEFTKTKTNRNNLIGFDSVFNFNSDFLATSWWGYIPIPHWPTGQGTSLSPNNYHDCVAQVQTQKYY